MQKHSHNQYWRDLCLFILNQKILSKDEFLKFKKIVLLVIYKKIKIRKKVKIMYFNMEALTFCNSP